MSNAACLIWPHLFRACCVEDLLVADKWGRNSTGLDDPILPRLPPTLLPFQKQSPVKNYIESWKNWLRTNGVNTDGAAAKVMNFISLGKKVRPSTFGKLKVYQCEYHKSPSVKKHEICSDPINADPICPSPNLAHGVGVEDGVQPAMLL